jgi:hypothetical protein
MCVCVCVCVCVCEREREGEPRAVRHVNRDFVNEREMDETREKDKSTQGKQTGKVGTRCLSSKRPGERAFIGRARGYLQDRYLLNPM